MGTPMPIIPISLDCGHTVEMEEWLSGDRRIFCEECGRTWIMTAVKVRTTGYQTKTEIKEMTEDDSSQAD